MCLDLLLKANVLRNYKQERFCGAVFLCDLIIAQKQMDKVSFSCPISVRFPPDI